MGKNKFRNYGVQAPGPNRKLKPVKEEVLEYESSEESFVLDTPAEMGPQYNLSDDSDVESADQETVKVVVKQVYKNPQDAHRYAPSEAGTSVVSHEAKPDEIDYEISFETFEPKSKKKPDSWKESIYKDRRHPLTGPQRFDRRPSFGLQAGPSTRMPREYLDNASVILQMTDDNDLNEITSQTQEDLLAYKMQATKIVPDWETTSMASSTAWENNEMSFK